MVNQLTFHNGAEMLEALQTGDLYSPLSEIYIFIYNDVGSLCSYDITLSEAETLENKCREQPGEYWSAFLGTGGWIYDDPSHELFNPDHGISNLELCERLYTEEWIYTTDLLNYVKEKEAQLYDDLEEEKELEL